MLASARASWGGPAALAVMLLAVGAYGVSVTLVVSLMPFWYDGFIGSVRRREV